jgi:hypothetical protein
MMPLVRTLPSFQKANRKDDRQVVDARAAFLKKYPAATSYTFGLLWQLIKLHHANISTVELWDQLPLEQPFLVPVLVDEEKEEALVLIVTKRWFLNAVQAHLSGYVVTFLLRRDARHRHWQLCRALHADVLHPTRRLSPRQDHHGYRQLQDGRDAHQHSPRHDGDHEARRADRHRRSTTTTNDPSFKFAVKYSVSDGDHRLINACLLVLLCVHIYCTFHFDKAKKCHNNDFVRAESIEYVKAFLKFLRDCSFPLLGH